MEPNQLEKTKELYTAYRKLKDGYASLEIEKSEGRIRITGADFQRYRTPAELVEHLEWISKMILAGDLNE